MRNDIDERGIRKLVRDPGIQREMELHAFEAYRIAVSIAPVGKSGSSIGEYKRRMVVGRTRGRAWASAFYGSQSYKAWWVEHGTVHSPAHHVLTRAAREAGMRLGFVALPGGRSGIGAI